MTKNEINQELNTAKRFLNALTSELEDLKEERSYYDDDTDMEEALDIDISEVKGNIEKQKEKIAELEKQLLNC